MSKTLSQLLREFADIVENINPKLQKYIDSFPEYVDASMDALKKKHVDAADPSTQFAWAIGKLPDGKFVFGLKNTVQGFQVPVVASGQHPSQ